MYAGRFVVGLGRDMPPQEGTFTVTEKVTNPVYHGRERTIPADDPANPLGERWIALGKDMGIHGISPMADIGSPLQPGSISLGDRDITDVYDILSVGSKVMILR
jgi:lipoprotein-anchoring transpeptidase ErfK/SrfK